MYLVDLHHVGRLRRASYYSSIYGTGRVVTAVP